MAITPIQIFQPQGGGVLNALDQGQASFANALNGILQVGRGIADKQLQQERDFLGERRRIDDLDFRKGRAASQDAKDDRRFARGIFESDRGFEASEEERDRIQDRFETQESRMGRESTARAKRSAADLSFREAQEKRLGKQFEFEQEEAKRQRELREEADRQRRTESIFQQNRAIGGVSTGRGFTEPNQFETTIASIFSPEQSPIGHRPEEVRGQITAGEVTDPEQIGSLTEEDKALEPDQMVALAGSIRKGAEAAVDMDPVQRAAAAKRAELLEGMGKAKQEERERSDAAAAAAKGATSGTGGGNVTSSQIRSIGTAFEKQQSGEFLSMVDNDEQAFPRPLNFVADPENQKEMARATAESADPGGFEFAAAKSAKSRDEYADMVDGWSGQEHLNMSADEVEAAKEKRGKFYDWANTAGFTEKLAKAFGVAGDVTGAKPAQKQSGGSLVEGEIKRLRPTKGLSE